jgi:hypothetical protein
MADREAHGEANAPCEEVFDRNSTVVGLDDRLAYRKTYAHAIGLCREEADEELI